MKNEDLSDLRHGGILLSWDKKQKNVYLQTEDTHTLIIGATRSGKTRTVVLPSIVTLALAGENLICNDPKGELYGYTYPLLQRLGYEVITIDFKNPERSDRYNFLQPVLDAAVEGNIPMAVSRARDISQMLVPDEGRQTDPIWLDGERSILTTAILAVVLECKDPRCQNMANVRHWIAELCTPIPGTEQIPLADYLDKLPPSSPLKLAMAIAAIAPHKMRGSFYTSALATLDLFQDPNIHAMSALTEFDHMATGEKKRAIFLILPDERSAYYPLAALFTYEQYQMLVQYADERGGRLPRRCNFLLDEFGNFVRIPDFDKFVTVGGGRGIRFHLFLQSLSQLDHRYGKELAGTIRSNCETWIYIFTRDLDTMQIICKTLGTYTIKAPSVSGSTGGNNTASFNLASRDLLTVDELRKLTRPYQLILSRHDPAVGYAPDISKTIFNRLLGMGSPDHNRNLLLYRLTARPVRLAEVYDWEVKTG